ncbi:hypothetical protein DQK91_21025 [Oceanidesulfovibrio marinus]|uniref:histidine kinase n=2 Tax=Oceanidesulfovibrio marinus TaxID=370038 RepID=A0A6P1ZBW5_9BACT|nr:hypothetical protein DQK91_21025 [Oceanidesulfovibrio marinus]
MSVRMLQRRIPSAAVRADEKPRSGIHLYALLLMNSSDKYPFGTELFCRAMFETSEEAVFVLDENAVVLAANDVAANTFGLGDKGSLVGRPVLSLLESEMLASYGSALRKVLDHGGQVRFEGDILGRTQRVSMALVDGETERHVLVFSRDVTDARRVDESLRREQQRQIFYMESLPGFVAIVDRGYAIRYANRAFRQLFGRPGRSALRRLIAACEDGGNRCQMTEVLDFERSGQWEWPMPDGRTYQVVAHPMTDVDGSLVAMLLGFDITEHRTAERALLQAQELQRAILDNVPALVWLKDKDARFRQTNSAFEAASGRSSQELAGLTEVEIWGEEQGAFYLQQDLDTIRTGEKRVFDVEFTDSEGRKHWVESSRVPLFGEEGDVIGLAGIAYDVTHRKEAQNKLQYSHDELERRVATRTQELEEANEALRKEGREHRLTAEKLQRAKKRTESLNRAKSNFLANVSHEIRTPLNAILGAAELAKLADSADETQRYLEIIRLSGKALSNLVNDILDFSKMESHRLRLEHVPFDLHALLASVRNAMGVVAEDGDLEVALDINPQLPSWVKGDPVRLRQILDNLVGNAIKFTPRGVVLIKAGPAPGDNSAEGSQRILVSVSDTGIGIPQDKQSIIFKDFEQADASISREYGGTGLGLAISRKLVEVMGGTIAVSSEVDKGSTFSFTVPVGLLNPEEKELFLPEVETGGRPGSEVLQGDILVVDDNAMNQELMRMALGNRGYTIHSVYSGEEALRFLSENVVDLVLMDIQMPEMDGLTAVRKVRREPLAVPSNVPVIAMTAHALPGDRERMIAAGCDDYLAKPVDMQELFALIGQYMAASRGASGKAGASQPEESATTEPSSDARQHGGDPRMPEDVRQALSLLGNRPDLLRRLERVYALQGPKDVAAMRAALATGARGELKRLVHLFKSTAATIGDKATSELARITEPLVEEAGSAELATMIERIAESSARMGEWLERTGDGVDAERS